VKVTEKDVAAVADLANLELTAEERTRMLKDLNSILGYIDTLSELDTTNVPAMAQTAERFGTDHSKTGSARFDYVMREDRVGSCLPREAALSNAPDTDGTFFKVPKVIER
jgi:aspartyl-tRNA(Asn)/glutamyl-tRNA(Gln) amidotransferase subunit C